MLNIKSQFGNNKILFFLIIVVITLNIILTSADILSINSGGSNNLVINPDNYIEGFLFAKKPSIYIPTGGGTEDVIEYFIELETDNWYFNNEEILIIRFKDSSNYIEPESISYQFIDINGIDVQVLESTEISIGEYEQKFIAYDDYLEEYTITIEVMIIYHARGYRKTIDILVTQPTDFEQIIFDLFGTKDNEITLWVIFIILFGIIIIVILIIILIILCKKEKKDDKEDKNKG